MKRTRHHQEGYVFKKGSAWYLRYYDRIVASSGETEHKQKCRKLADAVGRTRTKQAARELAEEFLRPLNDGTATPESTMALRQFVEEVYLPHVAEQKRVSTYEGYTHMWSRHLKSRSMIALRDFRTVDGENLLRAIARTENLNRTSLAHLKVVPVGRVSVRTPAGHSQHREPYEGCRTAQGETGQRNTCILSGAHPPDACGRSGACGNRDRNRGIHGSEAGGNTGNAVAELRRRSDADYAIRIWQPC